MEESVQFGDINLGNSSVDEEFKSCFGEDEDWQDAEEFSSEEQLEGNEEVSLKIPEGNKEEGDFSTFRYSEMLHDDAPDHVEDVVESIVFSDGLEEIVSECSLILLEGIDPERIHHDEDVSDCSLRLLEDSEEITSICSLMLYEDHGDDDSECSVRLCEGMDEVVLNLTRRSGEGQDDDILESSLRLYECHEDVSECSLRSSEDDDVVSECSLIFSEDHENDILECPMRLFEEHDKDDDDDDGVLVRIFSKGVSISADGDLGSRTSGIGVVLENPQGFHFLEVQKQLDFFVEEIVAEHLALMDGLLEALKNDFRKVLAYTDSNKVYRMITKNDMVEDLLLIALQERIQELADKFESFVLRQAPRSELKRPLKLAREAAGAFSDLTECSTCGEDKPDSHMIEMGCSHHLCIDCMFVYIQSQVQNSQDPLKCPHKRCKFYISKGICKSFFPSSSFESLEGTLPEMEAQNLWRFRCPFPDCSMLICAHHCFSSRQLSWIKSRIYCVDCPDCRRFVCTRCQVPWHFSMRCEEYQNLPLEERNSSDSASTQSLQRSSCRCCQQCKILNAFSEGSDRCVHEDCFSCGAEYIHGSPTCQCETLDENSESDPAPSELAAELWRLDCFGFLPGSTNGYTEQEKTQLAMIQRFLAGGIDFDFDSLNAYQSPPSYDSYLDTFKDLNQLPWLESFISVIGDAYQEDQIYR